MKTCPISKKKEAPISSLGKEDHGERSLNIKGKNQGGEIIIRRIRGGEKKIQRPTMEK